MSEEERYVGEFKIKNEVGKNLLETYEVNGKKYTDNLPKNAFINIPKKQYIKYEQQKEEIERLNNIINNDDVYGYIKHLEDLTTKKDNIINELESYIIENSFGSPANNCNVIETYKIFDKLQELKGSGKK